MMVGVQGDWTRRIVSDPPTHLYTREMKFAGLPYLSSLYRKGIMICTGSGIGAVLSTCLQLDNWFLIWIGSGLEETFGAELMGIVKRGMLREEEGKSKGESRTSGLWQKGMQSGGIIQGRRCILFDTKKVGRRPDTVKMLKDVYAAIEAEGLFCYLFANSAPFSLYLQWSSSRPIRQEMPSSCKHVGRTTCIRLVHCGTPELTMEGQCEAGR
jgi:hypothetical protein